MGGVSRPLLRRLLVGSAVLDRLRAGGLLVVSERDGRAFLPLGRIAFGLLGCEDVPVELVPGDHETVRAEWSDGTVGDLEDATEVEP